MYRISKRQTVHPLGVVRAWGLAVAVLFAVTAAPPLTVDATESRGQDTAFDHVFDHLADGNSASFHVRKRDGEQIRIQITNTATNCFDYDVRKVERAGIEAGRDLGDTRTTVAIKHEARYGGYIVEVSRKAQPLSDQCAGFFENHPEATIIVVVENEGIELDFTGGFTLSFLTNPVFASRKTDVMNAETGKQEMIDAIFRDEAAEDETALGIASFVHVYGKRWPKLAPSITFGLGLTESSAPIYFFGPFWRLGRQAFIGGGLVFGSVDRLPAGVQIGDPVPDANLFNNLGSRTDHALFFGISYSFLGDRNDLAKPFKAVRDGSSSGDSGETNRDSEDTPCAAKGALIELSAPAEWKEGDNSTLVPAGIPEYTGGVSGCAPADGDKVKIEVRKNGDPVEERLLAELDSDRSFLVNGTEFLEAGLYDLLLTLVGPDCDPGSDAACPPVHVDAKKEVRIRVRPVNAGVVLWTDDAADPMLLVAKDTAVGSTREWSSFGGSIADDETPETAAIRELFEETRCAYDVTVDDFAAGTHVDVGGFRSWMLEASEKLADFSGGECTDEQREDPAFNERQEHTWVPLDNVEEAIPDTCDPWDEELDVEVDYNAESYLLWNHFARVLCEMRAAELGPFSGSNLNP